MKKYLLVFSTLFFILGCSKKEAGQEDVLIESYKLIDSQRTDEAIVLLEKAVEDNPNKREYRTALISAYAHYAGVKIQRFLPLMEALKNSNLKNITTKYKADESVTIKAWIALIGEIQNFLIIFNNIPRVSSNRVVFLQQAINEYNFILPLTQSEALYRALLRIIYAKYLIDAGPSATDKNVSNCNIVIGSINDFLLSIGKEFIFILDDIQIAHPRKGGDLILIKEKIADSLASLSFTMNSASLIDETTFLFFKQSFLKEGMESLLKCEDKN